MEPKHVFQEALELPRDARAALAAELIASLDDDVDPDAEHLWAEEIQRRIRELESGAVQPVPWAEARKRILTAASRDPKG